MDTLSERGCTVNKKTLSAETEAFLHLWAINVETERTYCFTTVCNKTRRLLEGFLEVVFKSLVLVLLWTQLHEFTWKHNWYSETSVYVNHLSVTAFNVCRCMNKLKCYIIPLTRSSITWDNTFTTVMLPIRAKAMEAADRMKSPAKIAWKGTKK